MEQFIHDAQVFGAGFGFCAVICFGWYHGHLKQQFDLLKEHITSNASGGVVDAKAKIAEIAAKAAADIAALVP